MALRTFQSNPSLGGFGSESTSSLLHHTKRGKVNAIDGDAFAQIIKEITDNAFDALRATNNDATSTDTQQRKRVRVVIEKYKSQGTTEQRSHQDESDDASSDEIEDDLLLVTVVDNGIGMNDIQVCVDPFQTSKAHAAVQGQQGTLENQEAQTAGRYGLGLTLCFVHAQRLVPGSYSTIRSAKAGHTHFTVMSCIVDTEVDQVHCQRQVDEPKSFPEESGTAVRVVLPVSVGKQVYTLCDHVSVLC